MSKIRALREIERLSPEALADALDNNGFSGCRQLVIDKEIDGKTFLNITEYQLKQYKFFLKPPELHRLWSLILRTKDHPEEFVLSDPQYLNYKSPTKPKPPPPKKSAALQNSLKSPHNVNSLNSNEQNITTKPSFTYPPPKPTQPFLNKPPKPSQSSLNNSPKPIPPPLKKSPKPISPSVNSPPKPPSLNNSPKPPSLNNSPKPPPLYNLPKPPPVNNSPKPPPLNNSPKPPPLNNSPKPPPVNNSPKPPPLNNSPKPLNNSTKPPPANNSPKPPPLNNSPKPPPLNNSPKPPPLNNSPKPIPSQLKKSSKPTPPPLHNSPITPPPPILINEPRETELTSPTVDLAESLRNNLREKFKNALPESEESFESNSTDWSEDEDVPEENAGGVNYVSDNTIEIEEENERQRKKSAELFIANKQKLAMLFNGVRADEKKEVKEENVEPIYGNEDVWKMESTTVDKPPIPIPSKSEPARFNLEELKSKISTPELQVDKPPMPPRRFELPPKKLNQEVTSSNTLPKQHTSSNDHTSTMPNKSRNLKSPLPQPPSKLPPSLKLETPLFDLTKTPQRPPKRNSGNSNVIPEEKTSKPPVGQPKLRSSLEDQHKKKLNITKFHSEPTLNNEDDDTYEPAPDVGQIPKLLETFLNSPRVPEKNFQAPVDDGGYLITNELMQSSFFNKQHVPLPPIPPPVLRHDDELHRNEYFQNITNRDTVSRLLETKQLGYFLLRPSKQYFCTLVIKGQTKIFNVPILNESYRYRLLANQEPDSAVEEFRSLKDLIDYYKSHVINIKNTQVLLRR